MNVRGRGRGLSADGRASDVCVSVCVCTRNGRHVLAVTRSLACSPSSLRRVCFRERDTASVLAHKTVYVIRLYFYFSLPEQDAHARQSKTRTHARTAQQNACLTSDVARPPHYVLRRREVTILDCRPMKLARRVSLEQHIKNGHDKLGCLGGRDVMRAVGTLPKISTWYFCVMTSEPFLYITYSKYV